MAEKKDYKKILSQDILYGKEKYEGHYNINRELGKELFLKYEKFREANIYAHRIIANLFVSIKSKQHQENNENYDFELRHFEKEFMTKDNTSIVFKMPTREICNNANLDNVEKALDILKSFKNEWHTSITEDGRKIRSSGGLIKEPMIDSTKGIIRFEITSYWLKRLLFLNEYNKTLYRLSYNVNSTKMLFWHWLSIIPEKGTTVSYQKLNDILGLNYKSCRAFSRDFLMPTRDAFHKYSNESFNHTRNGKNITIKRYHLTADMIEKYVEEEDQTKKRQNEINYKCWYLKKEERHNLNTDQIKRIRVLLKNSYAEFEEAYNGLKEDVRKSKTIKLSDIKGEIFLQMIQENLIYYYLRTPIGEKYPRAYPIV
jgi:hypothetical protein